MNYLYRWSYRVRWLIAAGMLMLLVVGSSHAATLQVNVTDIKSAKGAMLVAVCKQADFLSAKCAYDRSAPAKAGTITVTFKDIPPGVYAVQAFDDANGNGKLDRNWLGWPKEGMGFSNNAPMHHGPPSYDDAAIRLNAPSGQITFRMRYY